MYSILYVDDESDLLEITKLYLEESGEFRVDVLASAKRIAETGKVPEYDAIVSDYLMPGMDGLSFLRWIRSAGSSIPFILFSGKGREEIVIAALNDGADFFLQKGGDPDIQFAELAHMLRAAVERRRADQALRESEANLRAIIENSSDIIASYDTELRLTVFNKACSEAYRTTFGVELRPGMHTLELFPPEIQEFWKEYNKRALAGESFSIDFRVMANGQERVFFSCFNPIRRDGRICGFSTITREKTSDAGRGMIAGN